MKLTPWFLAAIAPIAVFGASGSFLGHVAVLAVTFGIFFGTLSLGKTRGTDAVAALSPAVAASMAAPVTQVEERV